MSDRDKKPMNRIQVPEGTDGQQPFYPGDGLQKPGTFVNDKGETVTIPLVDSKPHKDGAQT